MGIQTTPYIVMHKECILSESYPPKFSFKKPLSLKFFSQVFIYSLMAEGWLTFNCKSFIIYVNIEPNFYEMQVSYRHTNYPAISQVPYRHIIYPSIRRGKFWK
jgi:hypothetical protein